ncbi:MAG: transposase family protein [Paracoccus sp. (in: a-proteobacteria)]
MIPAQPPGLCILQDLSSGALRCDFWCRWLEFNLLYGHKKIDLLHRFLPFSDGTPSHDQLGILFSRFDMEQFQHCFVDWTTDLQGALEGVITVDAKTLRHRLEPRGHSHDLGGIDIRDSQTA